MSNEFLAAAASWFGMEPDRLADATMSTNAQGLTVLFKVKLEADDYLGIADRMRAIRELVQAEEDQPALVPVPTLQEVMANPLNYLNRADCGEVMGRAMALSKDVRAKVEAACMPAPGPRHVEVPDAPAEEEEEEDTGLPLHVWLNRGEMTADQVVMAVGQDVTNGKYAVALDQLTEDQYARHLRAVAQGGAQS